MIFLAGRSSHETIKTPFSADSSRDKYEVRGFFKISNGTELTSCAMVMIASNSVEFKSLVTTIDGRSLTCYKNFTNLFYQQASRKNFLSKIDIITLQKVPIICTGTIICTVLISGGFYCTFSLLHYSSYYTDCSKTNVDCTVNFYHCTALPIIYTVLKN